LDKQKSCCSKRIGCSRDCNHPFRRYFQTRDTYTIIGTLHYRPGSAIFPGISAANITPTVSPEPSNITVTEWHGTNVTVTSYVYLTFPKSLRTDFINDFPKGFTQGEDVKVSGEMSYVDFYHAYVMNVTSISPYSSLNCLEN
jgi:hypothetical protein